MKKVFILIMGLLLIGITAYAVPGPFGLSTDYTEDPTRTHLLHKIVANKPIRYAISEEDMERRPDIQKADWTSKVERQAQERQAVIRAFNSWFKYTKQEIVKANRQTEFADILPILNRPVKLEEVSDQARADIIIRFSSTEFIRSECSEEADGCANRTKRVIFTPYLEYDKELGDSSYYFFILVHEIGHFIGLGDQYAGPDNVSPIHSTSHRVDAEYVEPEESLSVMGNKTELGCDDADGTIYALDYLLNYSKKPSEYSARVRKGWASLCADGTVYRNLRVPGKKSYLSKGTLYRFDKPGDISKEIDANPFLFKNKEIDYRKEPYDPSVKAGRFAYAWDVQDQFAISFYLDYLSKDPQLYTLVIDEDEKSDQVWNTHKATRMADLDGDYWTFPYGENSTMQVYPKKTMCSEVETLIEEAYYMDLYWVDIDPQKAPKLIQHALGTFVNAGKYGGPHKNIFGQLKENVMIVGAEYKEQPGVWTCNFKAIESNEYILSFKNGKLISKDTVQLDQLSQLTGASEQEIEHAVLDVCTSRFYIKSLDVEERTKLCKFFLEVEYFYQQHKNDQL